MPKKYNEHGGVKSMIGVEEFFGAGANPAPPLPTNYKLHVAGIVVTGYDPVAMKISLASGGQLHGLTASSYQWSVVGIAGEVFTGLVSSPTAASTNVTVGNIGDDFTVTLKVTNSDGIKVAARMLFVSDTPQNSTYITMNTAVNVLPNSGIATQSAIAVFSDFPSPVLTIDQFGLDVSDDGIAEYMLLSPLLQPVQFTHTYGALGTYAGGVAAADSSEFPLPSKFIFNNYYIVFY